MPYSYAWLCCRLGECTQVNVFYKKGGKKGKRKINNPVQRADAKVYKDSTCNKKNTQ